MNLAQEKEVDLLTANLTRLTNELKNINTRASILSDSIRLIENKIAQEKLNSLTTKGFICITQNTSEANVRDNPAINGRQVFSIPSKRDIKVLECMGNGYWKILYEDNIGYVNEVFLIRTNEMKIAENSKNNSTGSVNQSTSNSSTATSQSNFQNITQNNYNTGSKTIYTGPRGGRYHYSSSGKKVYEKKK